MDKNTSKAIDILRGVAILLVVFLHAHTGMQFLSETASTASNLLSRGLGALGVPLFMVISGFLAGFKVKHQSRLSAFRNLLKRCTSLAEVYVLWNLLVAAAVVSMLYIGADPGAFLANRLHDGVAGIFGLDSAFPIAYQFWFMRELIIISFVVGSVSLLVKQARVLTLLLAGIVVAGFVYLDYRTEISLTTFCSGYILGRYRALMPPPDFSMKRYSIGFFVALAASCLLLSSAVRSDDWNGAVLNTFILTGSVCVILGTLWLARTELGNGLSKAIAGSSFFIFAAHEPLLTAVKKIFSKHSEPLATYILSPLLTVLVLYLVFILLPFTVKDKLSLIFYGNRKSSPMPTEQITVSPPIN